MKNLNKGRGRCNGHCMAEPKQSRESLWGGSSKADASHDKTKKLMKSSYIEGLWINYIF